MGLAQWPTEYHGFSMETYVLSMDSHGFLWDKKIMIWEVNFQSLEVPSLNITAKAYTFYYLL